jgi:DNA-binding transcriptional ArsR family regulator
MKRLSSAEFHRICKALSDPRRCEILEWLAPRGELSCMDLVERLPVRQPTVSHHLKELSQAGLLTCRREGQFAFYRFESATMALYLEELARRMSIKE